MSRKTIDQHVIIKKSRENKVVSQNAFALVSFFIIFCLEGNTYYQSVFQLFFRCKFSLRFVKIANFETLFGVIAYFAIRLSSGEYERKFAELRYFAVICLDRFRNM